MEPSSLVKKLAPHLCLVLSNLVSSGSVVLSRVILVQGVSATVFSLYQFMLSTLSLATLAFIFERKRMPPLTLKISLEIFLLALIGMTGAQVINTVALYFIPSTIQVAVLNLSPAITYIICLIIRQEKLQLHTLWGSGKILGTLISVSGAFVLCFWHGSSSTELTTKDATNWTLGLLLVVTGVLASSIWYVMMGNTARKFPAEMSLTAIMMFFATIQTGVVAAVTNQKASQWQLDWSLELLNILIGGIIGTGLINFITAWVAGLKGAVFMASFSPLGILFTTLFEFLFLGHLIHVGSVIGCILIVLGLYTYLWSKSKEEEEEVQVKVDTSETATHLLG